MRNRIAETIVRNLFQGDQSYMPDALACADDILKSPEAGKIRRALDHFQGIIESTYAHDEETGERLDETDPEFSSADIVEFVMQVEGIVDEAIEAIGGIEGTTTMPADVGSTVNELRTLAAQYNDLMAEREQSEDGNGERSVERIDEEIDELLGETMAVTGQLLTPKTTPPVQPVTTSKPGVRTIHVGVVCRNASGEPDVVFYHVNQTEEGIKEGEHYEIAMVHASNDGYETPMLPFDEDDRIYRSLVVKYADSSDTE
jgi:hypothetical protein